MHKGKAKKNKPGVRARLKARGSEIADLGRTAVHQPREMPRKVGGIFREAISKMYRARGGGFHACGFVVTFLLLEARTLADDLFSSGSFSEFIGFQVIQWFFRFALDSLINTFLAIIWPIYLLDWNPIAGLIILVAGYFVFQAFVKEPLGKLIFGDEYLQEKSD